MDDNLVVTLLRHGITEDNKRRAYIGWTDSPLSMSSKEALDHLKMELTEPNLLFSSDLRRCVDTATALFSHPAKQMHGLREIHFGDWEGKTYEQLQGDAQYERWLAQPFDIQPPNGEAFQTFTDRVGATWEYIKEKIVCTRAKNTVIVTHGGVIRHLLATYSPDARDFWEWQILHGHGYKLTWLSAVHLKEGKRCTSLQAVPTMENVRG